MDLLWQTSTQSHSRRIVAYFNHREQLRVFPPGSAFAAAAEEVGPCRNHTSGPCLVLFRGMQLSPQQVNTWVAGSFLERPLVRFYWLQQDIPAEPDRQSLITAVVAAPLPEGLTAVRLDAYPKSEELKLGDELEAAGYPAPMHPQGYSHVLFLVHMPDSGLWRWSYMDRQQLWRHSPDKTAHFSKSVATAINKIAEVTQVLGLMQQQQPGSSYVSQLPLRAAAADGCCLQHNQQQPQPPADAASSLQTDLQALRLQEPPQQQQEQQQQPRRWAIDVGAAPGGWSSYLADSCGFSVIAIDPAELHPDVAARPDVHHIKARSSDALEQIDSLLQGEQADLLVCDANDHVARLPTFLGPVLSKLKPGAWVVFTLKFHGRGFKSEDAGHSLAGALPGLAPGQCVWLMANTLCERTYVARKL